MEKSSLSEEQEETSNLGDSESHPTEAAEAEHVKEDNSVLNTEEAPEPEASNQPVEARSDSPESSTVLDLPRKEIVEEELPEVASDEDDKVVKAAESPCAVSDAVEASQEQQAETSTVESSDSKLEKEEKEEIEEESEALSVEPVESPMTSNSTLEEKEEKKSVEEETKALLVETVEGSTASIATLEEKEEKKSVEEETKASLVETVEDSTAMEEEPEEEEEEEAEEAEEEADVSQSASEGNDPASSSLVDQVHRGSEEDFLSSIIGDSSYTPVTTVSDDVPVLPPSSSDLVDAFSLVTAAENEEANLQAESSVQDASSAVSSLPATSEGEQAEQSLCNICDKTFPSYQEMLLHRRRHKVTETLECPYCKREYTDRNRYEIHIRWHTGEKPFSCPICNKGFREKRKLKLHIRRHNSDLGHKCSLCPRSFEGKRSLAKHLLAHKNNTTVTPKVVKKTDGSVALAMPPDPTQKKPYSSAVGEEAVVVTPVQIEHNQLVDAIPPKTVVEEQQVPDQLEPPPITVVMPTPIPIEVPTAPVVEPPSILVSTPVAAPTLTPIAFSVPVNEQPQAVAATPAPVEIVRAAGITNMGPPPPVPPVSQDTLSFSVDDLMQYATPDLSHARPASLIHEHHADLEERLTETATTTLPVGMDEFASERLSAGGQGRQAPASNLNDSGEYPDLLDSDSNIATLEYGKHSQEKSQDLSVNDESGLTFATLSGVSPDYPEGKKEEKEEKPQRPVVVARKSVAPDPQDSIGKSKTEEIMTALASEAAAQLAKANITLPAGTCLVPASTTGGDASGGGGKKSLQVLPAVLTSGNLANNSSRADISIPNKPMTITIQYKIYSGEQGQPQTVAVKKSLTDLINEAPGGPRQFDSSSAASSASSTPIPPVLTAVKTRVPSLPSPSPSPEVPTSQTPVVVAKSSTTPANNEISTSTVPPIEVGERGPDPMKETRTEVTASGNKYEVPTIVTSGYDLDALLCTMCNRTFKNDKTLMGHMLGHFGVAPKMAHCPLCGLTLQKKSYARHLRLHGDVVPEICPYCQKGFRERRSLDKHIKAVHHSERPFACEYCPERFITEEERQAHHQNHQALQKGYIYQCQVQFIH